MNTRKVHTKMWRDGWFINLSRASKLLFLYLITNEYMGFTGYVEIPDQMIVFNTGLNGAELEACKEELQPKVLFADGWIYVVNVFKLDPITESNNVYKPYLKEVDSIPEHIKAKLEAPSKGLRSPSEGCKERNGSRKVVRDESVREGIEETPQQIYINEFNKLFKASYRTTDSRAKHLSTRLKSYSLEEILNALRNLSGNSFYHGDNDRKWKADPDFLIRSDEQVDKWLNAKSTPMNRQISEETLKILTSV